MRPAGLVSTPQRMITQFLKVGLNKGNSQLLIVYNIFKILQIYTWTVVLIDVPVGFLSSVLNSSAVRFEKLSSSNGFHAGCVGVLVASLGAETVAPALVWSWPASSIPSCTSWAVLGWDVNDLQGEKKAQHIINKTNRRRMELELILTTCATYWLRAASPLAPCGCCEESLTGTPATLLAAASLGVRWWPRSSVVFGEAGGVWTKEVWSEDQTQKIKTVHRGSHRSRKASQHV